jgi:hypothetical protein
MIDDIELLKIIEKDPRITPADIAVQLDSAILNASTNAPGR